jgi:hypothetical protein
LPIPAPGNPFFRWFVNQAMRSRIKDLESRRRTITLYLDKEGFCRTLGLPDEEWLYVRLVGREGARYRRTSGGA